MWRISGFLIIGCVSGLAQPAIPDSPAGKTLAAWLEAFNSGDKAKIEAYCQKYEPGKSENLERMLELREMTGGFNLVRIGKSEPLLIELAVKERGSETVASGTLRVKAGDPATVDSFRLRVGGPGPEETGAPPPPLDAAARERVIQGAIDKLNESYVFPETARKMEAALRDRQKRGEYDQVTSGERFAELLTEHLREVSRDKHLRVNYSPAPQPQRREDSPSPEMLARFRKQMERTNCGFEKAEILSGNTGYLKFNMFADPAICGPTASAAMNFLGNVEAIIFDLRANGGGDPAMIALISSYLFAEATHLNDIWERKGDSTQQYWTLPYVTGKRLDGKAVFVLTSKRTFSGAEEFSYNLKNLKRATIIGETTGGGAHPVRGQRIDDHFMIGVPFARAINPISKTNWEGTGVEPDIKVPAGEALDVARKMASEQIARQRSSASPSSAPSSDR